MTSDDVMRVRQRQCLIFCFERAVSSADVQNYLARNPMRLVKLGFFPSTFYSALTVLRYIWQEIVFEGSCKLKRPLNFEYGSYQIKLLKAFGLIFLNKLIKLLSHEKKLLQD